MKRAIFLISGFCWILFALGFVFFLIWYVNEGAGFQFFGLFFPSESVLLGLAHVVGLVMASVICLAIGTALCLHGILGVTGKRNRPVSSQNSPP
jgi:hypothetical protein